MSTVDEKDIIIDDPRIHPTAIIEPGAVIGRGCSIGAYTSIGSQVVMGRDNVIGPHCVIGSLGQHSSAKHELDPTYLHQGISIGEGNVIREFTTVHYPLIKDGLTQIGNDCYLMSYCHISHDTRLHNRVIVCNNVQIGGYSTVFDGANLGLSAVLHQYSTVGSLAMVGALSMNLRDIPPYAVVFGNPAAAHGINTIGLVRYGYSKDQIALIKAAYEARDLSILKQNDMVYGPYQAFVNKSQRKALFTLREKHEDPEANRANIGIPHEETVEGEAPHNEGP